MRKIILISLGLMLISCQAQRFALGPYLSVYKNDGIGHISPAYIILRTQPKFFELYSPGVYSGVFGEWIKSNDTLYLYPEWECYSRNYKMKLIKVDKENLDVITINQQYLIKNDNLYDITDYNIILPDYLNMEEYKAEYKRIK